MLLFHVIQVQQDRNTHKTKPVGKIIKKEFYKPNDIWPYVEPRIVSRRTGRF